MAQGCQQRRGGPGHAPTGRTPASPGLGRSVRRCLHSGWPRATTTTEEPLEEEKSLEESEEKHKRVAPHSSLGILGT